jgi:hypothetical protein
MCPLYVTGLIGPGDRKSIQPMAARLAPGDYDQLNHFVAAGVWDAVSLERELLVQADRLVGGSDAVLVIEDTAMPKKGKHSVGVAPQYASGEVHGFTDLRGKEVSVDAMTTGFAFVLREILAQNGISDDQVTFLSVGGGAQRLKALQEHKQTATLLNTPLDLIAETGGARRLAKAEDVIGAYQGAVGMTRRSWAAGHGDLLVAYLRGYHDSIAWLYDRDNRALAVVDRRRRGDSYRPTRCAEHTSHACGTGEIIPLRWARSYQ